MMALVLVAVMMFAMGTSALAAGTNTITVTNTVANETYSIYKMLDLQVNDAANPTAYKYTVAVSWTEFFTTGYGKDYVTIDATDGHVTWVESKKTDEQMVLFAQEAAKVATTKATAEVVASDETVTFTGLDNGYYLITSTLGTKAMIDSTPSNPAQTIAEKNPEDTIVKTVEEDSTGEYGESNDAEVGQTVNFKSTATIQPYTRNVYIHDTMDAGLDYNNDVAIDGLTARTDYIVLDTPQTGDTFTIQITDTYIAGLSEAATLTITYSAKLNEKAVVNNGTAAIVDQNNTTKITYGDKQSVSDETSTTTHKFEIKKHNSDDELLAGAKFKLYAVGGTEVDPTYTEVKVVKINDTNYRVAKEDETGEEIVTVETGNITVWGVDADNYALEEAEAPFGYNKMADKQPVTVNAENTYVADVLNQTGTELPSTGGIGTTIFYVIGAILVIGAGVILITRKRMTDAK